jgi:hypothetical protein
MTTKRSSETQLVSSPWLKNPQLDMDFTSEMSALYDTPNQWPLSLQWEDHSATPMDYAYLRLKEASAIQSQLPSAQREDSLRNPSPSKLPLDGTNLPKPLYRNHFPENNIIPPTISSIANPSAPLKDVMTVSPSQTCYGNEHVSSSLDGSLRSSSLANTTEDSDLRLSEVNHDPLPPLKQRESSNDVSNAAHTTTKHNRTGRKRGSEHVEPGSARSIYLDKNRKAASKCRSKQKKHQEDLVELARGVERRNKILKVEVAMLKESKQQLMDIVAQHVDCPNSRLEAYLQREADRIAFGVDSWPNAHTTSASSINTHSVDSTSPPEAD